MTCQYLYSCLCLLWVFLFLTCLDVSSVMLLISCFNPLVIFEAPVWVSNKPGRAERVFSTTSLISARRNRQSDYNTQPRPYIKISALQQEKYSYNTYTTVTTHCMKTQTIMTRLSRRLQEVRRCCFHNKSPTGAFIVKG